MQRFGVGGAACPEYRAHVRTSNNLQALFNVEPGEGRLVSLLLLQYFCLGMAITFVQTSAFTLLLTEFDAQTLSLAYIAMIETSPVVKGAALRTVAKLGGAEAIRELSTYLDDPQPPIKVGAIVGLLAGFARPPAGFTNRA